MAVTAAMLATQNAELEAQLSTLAIGINALRIERDELLAAGKQFLLAADDPDSASFDIRSTIETLREAIAKAERPVL